ncbi:MAG: branched-chain amino acid ABC transporter ATP-binding protein/permease [Deltaproteobacteria bacterium]
MNAGRSTSSRTLWSSYLAIIVVCSLSVLISFLVGDNRYIQRIILLVLIWAATCSAFNIISGYGGQIVFGYMMFVGTGAYTTVLLFKFLHVSPWLGMWAGAALAAFIALIIGLPTLRLRGAYFAVATVAFPLMTIPVLNHLGFEEVTIPFVRRASAMQFMDMRAYVFIASGFLAVFLIIVHWIESSRFGFYLRATKQNEPAAEGMGIPTLGIKLNGFMVSAALGAVMGAVYAFSVLYILSTHSTFGLFIIVRVLSISIVGGLSTLWGPAVGAAILVPVGEFLNASVGDRYPGVQDIVYGAALVAAIIYMPEGVWAKLVQIFRFFTEKSGAAAEPQAEETAAEHGISPGHFEQLKLDPVRAAGKTQGDSHILRLENIYKSFGGVIPLANVSIDVPRGKVLGVIGPNGAGKTTMFNVINGYLTPEAGKIIFEGRDVTGMKPHKLCRMGIGRTFQTAQVFTNMSILENILVGAFVHASEVTEARRIAQTLGEQLGLGGRLHEQAVGLSILETKSLEFSRALATQPKLLLVDEPMAGLNPEEADQIGYLVKAIAESGVTVLVIEHVVQNLVKIADFMVGLDGGLKVAEGTPEEVTSDAHIIEAYLGSKWRERHARG